jgi:hypothetical protein
MLWLTGRLPDKEKGDWEKFYSKLSSKLDTNKKNYLKT